MDESLQELENELKRLTPRAGSASWLRSLERELGAVEAAPVAGSRSRRDTSVRAWLWAAWALAGVAAAAALVVFLDARHPVSPTAEATAPVAVQAMPVGSPEPEVAVGRYEPVHASTVLYDLQEGAPTVLPDRTEGREVRYRYVDTYTWRNPATNASLRWSVPRDEVRLVRTHFN